MSQQAPPPPPGWYSDPYSPGETRWWDGRQWTNAKAPGASPVLRTAAPGVPPTPAQTANPRNPSATAGLVLGIIGLALALFTFLPGATGVVANVQTLMVWGYGAFVVLMLPILALLVCACIWSNIGLRRAKAIRVGRARALRGAILSYTGFGVVVVMLSLPAMSRAALG